jgi:Na+/melibiose symporter-like transporter
MRRLLGIRDVRVYLAGQGLSMLGDSALWLAMGIWVKQLTGSSAAAGLTWMAFMAPQLAGPAAGLLADRVRRRPLLLVVNLATAAAVLPLLLVHDRGDVWLIYAVMVAYGASNAVMGAAQPALLRTLVPDELLPDANGTLQTVREGLRLVAPLAGAGLFAAAGPAAVIALDAATFLMAAASLAALRMREPRPAPTERHPVAEAAEGIRHLWATPLLRRSLAACFIAVIAFGFSESTLFAVVDDGLHRAPAFIGALMAVQGAVSIVAGAVAATVLRRVGEPRLCALGLALFAAACPLLAGGRTGTVLAGTALMGGGIPWTMVGLNTLLQRMTPLGLQGRVYGAVDMLVAGPHVAAIAGGAALVATLDFRLVLGAMTVLLAAATLPLTAAVDVRPASPARATAAPHRRRSPARGTAR